MADYQRLSFSANCLEPPFEASFRDNKSKEDHLDRDSQRGVQAPKVGYDNILEGCGQDVHSLVEYFRALIVNWNFMNGVIFICILRAKKI